MSLRTRIARLEKHAAGLPDIRAGLPEGFDMEAEEARWETLLTQLQELVGDEAFEAAMPFLTGHWATVCSSVEPPPNENPEWTQCRRERQLPEARRMPNALLAFFRAVPEGLRAAVAKPEAFVGTGSQRAWVSDWLHGVVQFNSRIPPGLSPATMGRLVEVYLFQGDQVWSCFPVCTACGLRRPHIRLPPPQPGAPDFFNRCPHCGEMDMMWENRIHERHYPWQDLAAAELGPDDRAEGTVAGDAAPETCLTSIPPAPATPCGP